MSLFYENKKQNIIHFFKWKTFVKKQLKNHLKVLVVGNSWICIIRVHQVLCAWECKQKCYCFWWVAVLWNGWVYMSNIVYMIRTFLETKRTGCLRLTIYRICTRANIFWQLPIVSPSLLSLLPLPPPVNWPSFWILDFIRLNLVSTSHSLSQVDV